MIGDLGNGLQTCSGVKSDQAHVFVLLRRDTSPSRGPAEPNFWNRRQIGDFAMLPFVSQRDACETVIVPRPGCRNVVAYASLIHPHLIHHKP